VTAADQPAASRAVQLGDVCHLPPTKYGCTRGKRSIGDGCPARAAALQMVVGTVLNTWAETRRVVAIFGDGCGGALGGDGRRGWRASNIVVVDRSRSGARWQ